MLGATLAALAWANLSRDSYQRVWRTGIPWSGALGIDLSLQGLVNQGLLVGFFVLIGLEISREVAEGELRSLRRASVPVIAALAGMAVPAGIYWVVLRGSAAADGWAIPMATDVAFALGALGLVGAGRSSRLRVFLLTLAVADDIASVVVLVLFYSHGLDAAWLIVGLGGIAAMVALRACGIRWVWPLLIFGALSWWGLARAGVEAAVVGVAIGLLAPAHPREQGQPATGSGGTGPRLLERRLEPWVNVAVLPAFALGNAGFSLAGSGLASRSALHVFTAVLVARVVGKPLGIAAATRAMSLMGWGRYDPGIPSRQLLGLGTVAGVGFTIPRLIVRTTFPDGPLANAAIAGLLAASVLSVLGGAVLFRRQARVSSAVPEATTMMPAATSERQLQERRTRTRWAWAGFVVASTIAVADALLGHRLDLIGLLILGPACAALSCRMKPTALNGAWAVGLAVVLGMPDGIWRSYEHFAFLSAVVIGAVANTAAAGAVEKAMTRKTSTRNG
jgi:NhaA family Na+:H+ antiporter